MKRIFLAAVTAALLASGAAQAITPGEWGLRQLIGCHDGEGNVFSLPGADMPKLPYTTTFVCEASRGTLNIDSAGQLHVHAEGDQLPMTLGNMNQQQGFCAHVGTELIAAWAGGLDSKEQAVSCRDPDGNQINVFLYFDPDHHSFDLEAEVAPYHWPLLFYRIRSAISNLFSNSEGD